GVRGGPAPAARLRRSRVPARPVLPREEPRAARPGMLPAGTREEPQAPRVPGGRAAARAAPALRAPARGRSGRRRLPRGRGERLPRVAPPRARALPQGARRGTRQLDDPHLLRPPLGLPGTLEGSDLRLPPGTRRRAR